MISALCATWLFAWPSPLPCASVNPGCAHADEMKVTIDNFTFTPAEVKVKVGDTVTWSNHDDIPHTVVSAGKFRSKAMDTDGTFSFTFTRRATTRIFVRCIRT